MIGIDFRDLVAGVLLLGLGLFVGSYAASHYVIGEASRMGPGYFPMMLGWVLAGLGLLITLLSLRHAVRESLPRSLALRPVVAVFVSILVFSLVLERMGLVPATIALTAVAVFAERRPRFLRSLALAVSLALISWLIFSVGLQMTLPAFIFPG